MKKNRNPLVSIILPTYNWKEERIKESIDSVLHQSFSDYELIIINDGSTNDIDDFLSSYTQKDKRIIYVKNEKNINLTNTLNKGIHISKWKYIARIDDDDIRIDRDKLKKQIDFMENHDDYWIVWTGQIVIDEKWDEITRYSYYENDMDIREHMLWGQPFSHTCIVIRRSSLDIVWWKYDSKRDHIEDYELYLRMWTKSKFKNLKDFCVQRRINKDWICSHHKREQMILALKLWYKYFNNYPHTYLTRWLLNRFLSFFFPEKFIKFLVKIKKKTTNTHNNHWF